MLVVTSVRFFAIQIFVFVIRLHLFCSQTGLVPAVGTGTPVALAWTGVNVPGSSRDLVLDDGRASLLAADERSDRFGCRQETVDDLC